MLRTAIAVVAFAVVPGCVAFDDGDPGPGTKHEPGPGVFPDLPLPAIATLQEFSGCPELPDVIASGFAEKWASLGSTEGACQTCHNTAQYGFEPIEPDAAIALDQMTKSHHHMAVFYMVEIDDVVVNGHFDTTSGGTPPYAEHPHYDVISNGALDALFGVYDPAHERWLAGTCGPPRF